jgi:hypothetical protein
MSTRTKKNAKPSAEAKPSAAAAKPSTTAKRKSPSLPHIYVGRVEDDYHLTKLAKTQGDKSIYKLEFITATGRCTNYIDDANKHVVFKNNEGRYIILRLPTSRSPSPKSKAEMIHRCAVALSKKHTIGTKNVQLVKDAILIQSCAPDVDLTAAQNVLAELNRELQKKCPELHLKLAPYYEYLEPLKRYGEHGHLCIGCQYYNTLILALCRPSGCISSIEMIMIDEGEILINSKTDENEEGKKYNKLLRAVLSIISARIPGIEFFKSTAINPVSTWLLLEYSNARIEEGDPFIEYVNGRRITKEIIQQYYALDKNSKIKLIVDLNSENASRSMKEFHKLVAEERGEVKC